MRKAQASMEYLMSYGWALLVVIGLISALAYFGVMRPSLLLPEQCVLGTELLCKDLRAEPDKISMLVYNSGTFDMNVIGIDFETCSSTPNQVVKTGQQKLFIVTGCSNGEQNEKLISDVDIHYTSANHKLNKTLTGRIVAKVE